MLSRRPLLLSLAALPTWAAAERPLVVGVSLLGWAFYEDKGRLRGFGVDLIERLAAEAGVPLTPSLRPRARVMLDFQAGDIDVVTSSLRNPDRDLSGDYEPYAYTGYEIVAHADIAPRIQGLSSMEAIPKLSLGMVRGAQLPGVVGPLIERLAAQNRIEWAVDFNNLAARMKAGRVLIAVFPTAIHLKLSHDGELPGRFQVLPLPESPPQLLGMYFHRQRIADADRQRLMAALRRLVQSGEVQRIYARYLGSEATQRMFNAGRAAAGGLRV
jgi:polar amino acid transport system substrate-binding protein